MDIQFMTPSTVESDRNTSLPLVEDPPFKVDACLYFLSDQGHYLFRSFEKRKVASKFVTANDVRAAFTQKEEDSGWLPAGIVRVGYSARGRWYVYSAPAQRVTLDLEGKGEIHIPIPRTVLLGMGQIYYLWAMRCKYFDPDASAYHAPFPNIDADGRICWGNSTAPEANPEIARRAWDLFFGTIFNDHQKEGRSHRYKKDIRELLLELNANKARSYPTADLVEIGNIGGLINRMIR